MKIKTSKVWNDRDDVELTTFLTMPDDFFPNPVKKPAIIVCPGGAYQMCPRHGNEGDPIAMTFAADGYQCFVLEYSVAEKSPEEKVLFPNQLLDFGKAILMIRENADEWLVDVNRISIIGFSAGAHLCGMLATTWHNGLLSDYFGTDSEVFRPLSAMCIYGLFDYVYQNQFNKMNEEQENPMLKLDLRTHVFGTSDPDRATEEKYSPYYQVSEKTCPMFMAAAVNDGAVPSIQSVRMAEKLHEFGIPYELHMFQFGDHGFSLGRNLIEPFRDDLVHSCAAWVPLAKDFLTHQITPETTEKEKTPFEFEIK